MVLFHVVVGVLVSFDQREAVIIKDDRSSYVEVLVTVVVLAT